MNFERMRPYSPARGPAHLPLSSKYQYPKPPDEPVPPALAALAGLKVIQLTSGGYALTSVKWKSQEEAEGALIQMLITASTADLQSRALARLRGSCNRLIGKVVRMEQKIAGTSDSAAYLKRFQEITKKLELEPMPANENPAATFPDAKK